jgi:uncharacterized membrane-anchored protein
MEFKIVPALGSRYWIGTAIASMCGANIGDVASDEFGLSNVVGIAVLAVAFATNLLVSQRARSDDESSYWTAIIILHAAATNIADLAMVHLHLGYLMTAASTVLSTVTLAIGSALFTGVADRIPRAGPGYWMMMLMAGTLGTVLSDAMKHEIAPFAIAMTVFAFIATAAVAMVFAYRATHGVTSAATASYWAAIVAVRALSTTLADIAAYLLSLPVSIGLSSLLLAGVLTAWHEARSGIAEQSSRYRPSDRRKLNRISPQSSR